MWCPKCRMEYRDGITVCADCGTELVEGTAEDFDVIDLCEWKDQEQAQQFVEYLEYSNVKGAKITEDQENEVFMISVPTDSQKQAEKAFKAFVMGHQQEEIEQEVSKMLSQEDEDESEYTENLEEEEISEVTSEESEETMQDTDVNEDSSEFIEDITVELLHSDAADFVTREDAYKDMKFSGITFIIFGILGAIYLVLSKTDVLPVSYNNIVFVILVLMFVGFVIMGIVNCVKSKAIRLAIPEEQAKMDELLEWLEQNLTDEMIAGWTDEQMDQVENDFHITNNIRTMLHEQFSDVNVGLLEYVIEGYYYDRFVKESEED